MTVHHDHSLRRALNRGRDFQEGPQTEFIEDHGFLIETDKIATVIDPKASFTLEYLDMIMTIRANHWKVCERLSERPSRPKMRRTLHVFAPKVAHSPLFRPTSGALSSFSLHTDR
jgi:hypothetical protein